MSNSQLNSSDLNLLVVLNEVLRERSVTRAAERLNVTPSAVSHALRRLRQLFDDELLLRDGRHMRPTARAEKLAEALPTALEQLTRAIAPLEPFKPGESARTFRLAAPDFIAPLVPRLLQDIQQAAPGVQVELLPYGATSVQAAADGRCDALVARRGIRNDALRSVPLGTWPWTVYARAGHPAFNNWSQDTWSAYPHLQVRTSVVEAKGPADQSVEDLGLRRTIGAVIPHFSMAAEILAETDMLLTAPSVTFANTSVAHHLDQRPLPFELAPMGGLALYRSAAHGDEPAVRWFLDRVAAVFDGLDVPGDQTKPESD